jgi:hypothetical protein
MRRAACGLLIQLEQLDRTTSVIGTTSESFAILAMALRVEEMTSAAIVHLLDFPRHW